MKLNTRRFKAFAAALLTAVIPPAVYAENMDAVPETEEAGFAEIRDLLDAAAIENMDGMDLETLTEALNEAALSEYYDPGTGLYMQYPSIFCFSEEDAGATAVTADGNARMNITAVPDSQGLSLDVLSGAVRMEHPAGELRTYTNPACLRCDEESNEHLSIDLYFLDGDWLMHVQILCRNEIKDSITPYIEYMIHSVSSGTNEVG